MAENGKTEFLSETHQQEGRYPLVRESVGLYVGPLCDFQKRKIVAKALDGQRYPCPAQVGCA